MLSGGGGVCCLCTPTCIFDTYAYHASSSTTTPWNVREKQRETETRRHWFERAWKRSLRGRQVNGSRRLVGRSLN